MHATMFSGTKPIRKQGAGAAGSKRARVQDALRCHHQHHDGLCALFSISFGSLELEQGGTIFVRFYIYHQQSRNQPLYLPLVRV